MDRVRGIPEKAGLEMSSREIETAKTPDLVDGEMNQMPAPA